MPDDSGSDTALVSVVVPTYGRDPLFLADAIDSIAAQTYDAIELVVVDDSPPETRTREATFAPTGPVDRDEFERVRWLTDGGHDGAGAARNAGIRAATGAYIAFLDDDDTWIETKLERQVAVFEEYGSVVGLVYCGQEYVDETGEYLGEDRPQVSGDVLEEIVLGRPPEPFSTAIVRADVPETVGFIDEQLPVREDQEWFLRIAKQYEIRAVDELLTRRRLGHDGHLSGDWVALAQETYPRFLEKHRAFVSQMGPWYERRFVGWLSKSVGAAGIKAGHTAEARQFLLRSLKAYPFDPMTYVYLGLSLGGQRVFRSAQRARRLVARLHRIGE